MKKYIAQKPCFFKGRQYYIGEEIPADAVLPERENALLKYGTIAVVEIADPEPENTQPDGEQNEGGKPDKKAQTGKKV